MDSTPDGIKAAVRHLRERHSRILAPMPQSEIVAALQKFADLWRDPNYSLRLEAEEWQEPFPFSMVEVSLNAILESLRADALWALIDAENAREAFGYPIIGHIIAGNTPLLSWVSLIRTLLVRSASFVKLPSQAAARWGEIFVRSMTDVSPELASCIDLQQWPGGTVELETALCRSVDLVMAHGSNNTMQELRSLCPKAVPFVGYGHRVSFGLVTSGNANSVAADGFAKDVLLYDQGGCLSPQTIFVEGNWDETTAFADLFASALPNVAALYPVPCRTAPAAMTVREARGLAEMEQGNEIWADDDLRWTVIARLETAFVSSPTYGIVSVQPLKSLQELPEALASVVAYLQGCSVAGDANDYLPNLSRVCAPGELQAPPLGWRQDGRDVLRVLLPPYSYRGRDISQRQ